MKKHMVSQYKPENEFTIDLINDSICTTHSPYTGKLFYLEEKNTTSENPYGINFTINPDSEKLKTNTKKGFEKFQNILLGSDKSKTFEVLNDLYLNNDFRELTYCLYHIKKNVRHCAFSLLCSKIIIDQTTAPFFKVFFRNGNPISTVLIPDGYQNNYIKFLERDFVRWLTAIEKNTGHDELWKKFSEEDLSIANIVETIQTKEDSEGENSQEIIFNQSPEVNSIVSWLATIPEENSTIMSDQSSMKAEKIYRLRGKWLHSVSKLKTAHKFITRLIEKWDMQDESEFTKSFKMFFSGLTRSAKQVFFIFGASSQDDKIQSLSYLYITSTMPIVNDDFFSTRKNAQNYVKAIYQSQLYIKTETQNSNAQSINNHFENLMTQLKEVEEIYIPTQETQDPSWAIATLEPIKNAKASIMVEYPHRSPTFNKYHFEIEIPKLHYLKYAGEEGTSAHEINAISGLAIEYHSDKSMITAKPLELTPFDLQYKMSFMASSKFDRRAHKKAKIIVVKKVVKEKTLEDIFNLESDEDQKQSE
ncbi:MAG: hypothetical protein COA79_13375 [Planctomycetota bacterium]|nr:MAG: hypothetical protein COA79_13375 [Planctomycetota bacterium]